MMLAPEKTQQSRLQSLTISGVRHHYAKAGKIFLQEIVQEIKTNTNNTVTSF